MALLLKHEDIDGLLKVDEVVQAVRSGLVEQGEGQVQLPPRITIDTASGYGWLRLMPVILNGSGLMGYKAMHSTPSVGVRYMIALYDMKTGELLTEMDADWVTSRRTAAMAAVAIDALARREIRSTGVIGSSEQARALLTAAASVRRLSTVKVFSPNKDNRTRFAEKMSGELKVPVVPVDSAREAVSDSDLVLNGYRAGTTPVLMGSWLKPGAHVAAISAVRPEFREMDEEVWRRSDVIVVDDRDHVLTCGDGRCAVQTGSVRPEDMIELWQLVSNKRAGRRDDNQITLFKSVGTALQDLCVAAAIYRRAREKGVGMELGEFPHVRPF
jgi:alanine dehydrogenase